MESKNLVCTICKEKFQSKNALTWQCQNCTEERRKLFLAWERYSDKARYSLCGSCGNRPLFKFPNSDFCIPCEMNWTNPCLW